MPSLDTATHLLTHYGYALLFPLAVIEGPIVTVIAGALVSLGYMSGAIAYVIIVIGDTVGDVIHYAVGRFGGKPFLEKWGNYFGLKGKHIALLEHAFRAHEGRSYLLGKLAHGVGGAVLVIAGLVRASFVRFMGWNIAGTMVKSLGLLLLGYYFAHALTKINSTFDIIASVFIIVGIIGSFVVLWWYGKKHKLE